MASFQSFLHVGGKKYEILYSDLLVGQVVDSLGRPASPTLGGIFTVVINTPGSDDATLYEWMVNPTKILDGKLVFKRIDSNATLKVIKFYNAYCVGLDVAFDGTANASFFRATLRISPEQIDIGGIFHDNHWPEQTPVRQMADEDSPPGALSEGLHTLLDVVGMIPVVGELADGANALFYAAQGNYTDAALSAAAMIPLAGNVVGAAKLAKRGAKIIEKVRGLKQAKKFWKSGADLMEKGGAWAGKLQRGSTGFLGSPRLSRSQLQQFKQQAKNLGAELEIVKDKSTLKKMDAANAQAGFDASVNKLYVRKGATAYEVSHEMAHAAHNAKLGKEVYGKLTRLEKEAHVYEKLMEQSNKLTKREIEHAKDYLNTVRGKYGLLPTNI